MKTKLLIIITFTIMLIGSLVTVSHISEIQQEIWIITGEYTDLDLTPSILYDYQLMYAVVLVTFGIIGAMIFGISFVFWRKRK